MFGYKVRNQKYCFDPHAKIPFKISRTKIDLFIECPRCFYIDQRLGVGRPSTPPFSLNAAVDELLKKEFDIHRVGGSRHPLVETYGIDAVPFQHEKMSQWRDALRHGVQYHDHTTNLIIRGGVDDIWVSPSGELMVVDYKATSKKSEVTLDAAWQDGYKRQVEVYQWLLRKNGFKVSDTAYFVYVNGRTDAKAFDGRLEFDLKIIPYRGSDAWIEPTLAKLYATLTSDAMPPTGATCEYCSYREAAGMALRKLAGVPKAVKRASKKKVKIASIDEEVQAGLPF